MFFGLNILDVAHALQLVRYAHSNSNAYLWPPLRNLQNVNLFPKNTWRLYSPFGDLGFDAALFQNSLRQAETQTESNEIIWYNSGRTML